MLHAPIVTAQDDTLPCREPGWYLDGELIGGTWYTPTDDELAAGAQLDLDGIQ